MLNSNRSLLFAFPTHPYWFISTVGIVKLKVLFDIISIRRLSKLPYVKSHSRVNWLLLARFPFHSGLATKYSLAHVTLNHLCLCIDNSEL